MNIIVKEVITRKSLREFVRFPNRLYRDNKYYVPQIESMDINTFDPKKNHAFEVCEGKYWLAYDDNGNVVGRIAGIINYHYNKKVNQKICKFGWIDFIDDYNVVKALLDTVENYAREKGMDVVCGPLGFLEFDVSGVLVDGFDQLPTAYGKYNAPYYEPLILKNGYVKDIDFVEYFITVPDLLAERYEKFSKLVAEKEKLHEAPIHKHNEILDYTDGIFKCMNDCYSKLHGYSELSSRQCLDLKNQFFKNINIDFISVILDEHDQVVAFGICMPSLAKALQKTKGKLFPIGFIHILHALKHNDTLDALLIAIDDKYKNKGVNSMIVSKIIKGIRKHHIKYIESTRELEDNQSVRNLWRYCEYRQHKRARIYIKYLK